MKLAVANFGLLRGKKCRKLALSYKIRFFICFWHTILNLLLIIITFPAIKNPGPNLEEFTCIYQKLRGFVPFSELGKKVPNLDVSNVLEFQTYIFEHKPCMVILNETWLSKCHLDNEIFLDGCYTCYRLDRSVKTHPPDKNDPKKFKLDGDGVLIAVRSDLDIEHKKLSLTARLKLFQYN